jgi:Transposase IS4
VRVSHNKLVTTAYHESTRKVESEARLNHGTAVLDRMVRPWYRKGDRIVCADSYFSSVEAAMHLSASGLCFIGVVETVTYSYPMTLMQEKVLPCRGECKSFVHRKDGEVALMALVWADRERRYFFSMAASAVVGAFYERTRWRQMYCGQQRVTF